MGRYRVRHFLAVFVLLATPAFTCGVAPAVFDLIERMEAVEAELDAGLIVIDANGVQVGSLVTSLGSRADVSFDIEGFPLFQVSVRRNDMTGFSGDDLFFESTNCSGPPLMVINTTFIQQYSWVHTIQLNQPIHVPNVETPSISRTIRSRFGQNDICRSGTWALSNLVPAIPVFVWQDEFTPPFRIVTRGEFLAMQ